MQVRRSPKRNVHASISSWEHWRHKATARRRLGTRIGIFRPNPICSIAPYCASRRNRRSGSAWLCGTRSCQTAPRNFGTELNADSTAAYRGDADGASSTRLASCTRPSNRCSAAAQRPSGGLQRRGMRCQRRLNCLLSYINQLVIGVFVTLWRPANCVTIGTNNRQARRMLRDLLDLFRGRRGDQLAAAAINNIDTGFRDSSGELAEYENVCRARQYHRKSSFVRAYEARWSDLGASDAQRGICRRDRYKIRAYDLGWCIRYEALRSKGWRHSELERYHEQILKEQAAAILA
ncbi:hypothetical protein HNQ95_003672 [Aminobacter ciceronei]|uniref:Uncharacterized protein n=1 Tax=Aminobacter ciceronei TaxID=150723 RepID=A0ABR6CAR8_9HYPH|nr:hypothetical protein [Aminobacter ciceronei]MBA9021660.1 hypothetical protein [Aminobacter ciceronei]